MKFLRNILVVLMLAFSMNANSQILYTTENEFELQSKGWENFGQKSGGKTTLNMTSQDFEDYTLNYVPCGSGLAVLGICSGLYLINKRRKR